MNAGSTFVDFPDAAMIPSFAAQAMQTFFRFRPLTDEIRPLSDPTDYELLRAYIASGEQIATTFYGPVSFDAYGQNQGRRTVTLQVNGSGTPELVFPAEIAEKDFSFPAPANSSCKADAWRLEYREACLLCAPEVCELDAPPPPPLPLPPPASPLPLPQNDDFWLIVFIVSLLLFLLLGLATFAFHRCNEKQAKWK